MRKSSFIAALTVSAVTAVISAPPGHASTDCSQEGIAQAVQATNSALGIYFDRYPEANAVITDAYLQPESVGASNIRAYFVAHPQQDRELKDIMAPLDDKKRECRTV
ncbi:hemophore-related protein [Mycobacteroides abscessus]|uniref:hemophore-related protein n=1 Tax=Mycobacteroides abscessus TaxID=36809 RepID=UPI00163AA45D|nr:hemophore-related protein [Mycobacteroides abscessus]